MKRASVTWCLPCSHRIHRTHQEAPEGWFGAVRWVLCGARLRYLRLRQLEPRGSMINQRTLQLQPPGRRTCEVHAWMDTNYVPAAAIEADESKLRDTSWALVNSFRTADRLLKGSSRTQSVHPHCRHEHAARHPVSNALSEMMQRWRRHGSCMSSAEEVRPLRKQSDKLLA